MKKVEPSLGTNGYQRCRQGKLNLIKKKSGYLSSRQYRKRSQFVTGWGHWMVTKRCRQRNLHEMSYTIKYRVETRMATGVAVSTERVKKNLKLNFDFWWKHPSFVNVSPTLVIDTWMEKVSQVLLHENTNNWLS